MNGAAFFVPRTPQWLYLFRLKSANLDRTTSSFLALSLYKKSNFHQKFSYKVLSPPQRNVKIHNTNFKIFRSKLPSYDTKCTSFDKLCITWQNIKFNYMYFSNITCWMYGLIVVLHTFPIEPNPRNLRHHILNVYISSFQNGKSGLIVIWAYEMLHVLDSRKPYFINQKYL